MKKDEKHGLNWFFMSAYLIDGIYTKNDFLGLDWKQNQQPLRIQLQGSLCDQDLFSYRN